MELNLTILSRFALTVAVLYVDSAKFGADFYTEIYKASDVAVDAISAVNGGIASLSTSVADFAEVVTYSAGMIIVAIGMGVIAVSVLHIKKED